MQQTQSISFHEHKAFIENRHEPDWLLAYRQKNFEVFKQSPLKKSKYINVQSLQELLMLPAKKNELPKVHGKGMQVFSFEDSLKKFPEKIQAAIEAESAPKDQFEAFINAFFDNGFVVIADTETSQQNEETSRHTELEFVPHDKSVSKNFFFFEGKKNRVLQKIYGNGAFAFSENDFLAEGTQAQIVRIHLHSENSTGFFYNQSIVKKDAEIVNSNAWIGGKTLRSNTFNNLLETGANAKQFDVLLLDNDQLFDLNNTAMHLQTDSTSNTLFKGITAGKSRSVFDAMIKIVKDAQRSSAFLQAHSMLLSQTASASNIPGLEIEADDVKATHSASVAHVEDEHVYYLQARGISKKMATQLIVTGFIESVLFNLDEAIAEKVFNEVEKKTTVIGEHV